MSIILASIYRNKFVLADYTQSQGTFETIALEVAGQCQSEKGKFSYNKGSYVFHTLSDGNYVFLCMADINYMRADAYSFLEQLKRLLYEKCNQQTALNATNYGLQKILRNDIKQKFELFNSPEASKLRTAQHNLEVLKDVVVQNLDKVLERNERLELIVQKSTQMTVAAGSMRSQATAIRKQQQWRKIKLYIIIGLVSCLAIYILLVIICGGFGLGGCFGSSSSNDDKKTTTRILTVGEQDDQSKQQQCPLSFLSAFTAKISDYFSGQSTSKNLRTQQEEQQEEEEEESIDSIDDQIIYQLFEEENQVQEEESSSSEAFEQIQKNLAEQIAKQIDEQRKQKGQEKNKNGPIKPINQKIKDIKKALENNQLEEEEINKIVEETLKSMDKNFDYSKLQKI